MAAVFELYRGLWGSPLFFFFYYGGGCVRALARGITMTYFLGCHPGGRCAILQVCYIAAGESVVPLNCLVFFFAMVAI